MRYLWAELVVTVLGPQAHYWLHYSAGNCDAIAVRTVVCRTLRVHWDSYRMDKRDSIPGRAGFASRQTYYPEGTGVLTPGVKQPACEADYLPPSGAEVNVWSYTSTPLYVFMAWHFR